MAKEELEDMIGRLGRVIKKTAELASIEINAESKKRQYVGKGFYVEGDKIYNKEGKVVSEIPSENRKIYYIK